MMNRPIGIFDSGIGGLTVASAIQKQLPDENFVYFGDTAHLPYGDKSRELIQSYANRITQFLIEEKNCKAIVIACNTASAAAYETLRDQHLNSIPIINVIDPMIEEVIKDEQLKKVGIIATRTTISSGVYQEKLTRRKPELEFAALATPLLASMIEEGFYNDNISNAVLNEYLSDPALLNIDALILACTHYPLIKKEIDQFYKGKVKLFDSAEVVASKLKRILTKENMLRSAAGDKNEFYVSDYTESFERSTQIFFNERVELRRSGLWD